MDFEEFKIQFDNGFAKVIPAEFVKEMESLGYVFEDIEPKDIVPNRENDL